LPDFISVFWDFFVLLPPYNKFMKAVIVLYTFLRSNINNIINNKNRYKNLYNLF